MNVDRDYHGRFISGYKQLCSRDSKSGRFISSIDIDVVVDKLLRDNDI